MEKMFLMKETNCCYCCLCYCYVIGKLSFSPAKMNPLNESCLPLYMYIHWFTAAQYEHNVHVVFTLILAILEDCYIISCLMDGLFSSNKLNSVIFFFLIIKNILYVYLSFCSTFLKEHILTFLINFFLIHLICSSFETYKRSPLFI